MSDILEDIPEIETVDYIGPDYGMFLGGLALGATVGGAGAYFFLRKRFETKYSKIAEDEIAKMREHFHNKEQAVVNTVEKRKLGDLVEERGYGTPPSDQPMSISPPDSVVAAAKENVIENPNPEKLKPPVPMTEAPTEERIFDREPPTEAELGTPRVEHEWDKQKELRRRSPLRPYVIHVDELRQNETYENVTLTWYSEDDVVCDDADEVMDVEDREKLLGEDNLDRFGHGSGDATVVYIRNDQVETDFTVNRSPNSFLEEVHGMKPEPPELKHGENYPRRRRRFDDE